MNQVTHLVPVALAFALALPIAFFQAVSLGAVAAGHDHRGSGAVLWSAD